MADSVDPDQIALEQSDQGLHCLPVILLNVRNTLTQKRMVTVQVFPSIDKISSLSCQKVADSITSSKMGNNVAKQASVLLRSIPEYIRRYPSAYCTI